ncbi:DUF2061 domain-containing protein [Candidatus Margulisiibacteriota bacterium]
MIDKPYRSIIKAFSWRITATMTTMIISFLITGKIALALSIGFFEFFTKFAIYYGHERLWNKIKFGRIEAKPPEYSI